MINKFKIKVGRDTSSCSIEMNGQRLEGVVRASFDLSAGRTTTLTLEIYGEIEVDGEFQENLVVNVHEKLEDA